jgi:hypothetical protein
MISTVPRLNGQYDPLVHWTVEFVRKFLQRSKRKIGGRDMREVELRRLENRPELPKFYRRQNSD